MTSLSSYAAESATLPSAMFEVRTHFFGHEMHFGKSITRCGTEKSWSFTAQSSTDLLRWAESAHEGGVARRRQTPQSPKLAIFAADKWGA